MGKSEFLTMPIEKHVSPSHLCASQQSLNSENEKQTEQVIHNQHNQNFSIEKTEKLEKTEKTTNGDVFNQNNVCGELYSQDNVSGHLYNESDSRSDASGHVCNGSLDGHVDGHLYNTPDQNGQPSSDLEVDRQLYSAQNGQFSSDSVSVVNGQLYNRGVVYGTLYEQDLDETYEIIQEEQEINGLNDIELPDDISFLTSQVAGHTWFGKSIGILRQNGIILKPIPPNKGTSEIDFYEDLIKSSDPQLIELKEYVPKYFGERDISIEQHTHKCIMLEDLTRDFKEPCIIDIKIGRRTWDPKANYDKIIKEEGKYHDCKREFGFCIPGFQVYKIKEKQLVKYDKSFGRTLNKDTVPDALKMYLNADSGFCRSLLVQILSTLWRIQHWARNQRRLRLYSSSILIIYDARRLKECLRYNGLIKPKMKLAKACSLYRPLSLAVLNNAPDKVPTGFSGQNTKEGPILTPASRKKAYYDTPSSRRPSNNVWQQSIHSLRRTHSFQNNYDKNVACKRQDYSNILEDLCCDYKSELWATVKMIDFAHVHPAQNCDIDNNYLEGIENLVKLLEDFLAESE